MINKMTENAQTVLKLAEKAAVEYGDGIACTEHILLAILIEGKNLAAQILHHLGLGKEQVLAALNKQSGGGF